MKRVIVATAAALVPVLLVPLTSSPAQTPGEEEAVGVLTISARPKAITYGEAVRISGELKEVTNKRDIPVTLQSRRAPFKGPYELLTNSATGRKGAYAFKRVEPLLNTRYRTIAPLAEATSKRVLVEVRMKVTLRVDDLTPKAGSSVELSGTVAPDHDDRPVFIQRRAKSGRWKTVKRTLLKDAGNEISEFSERLPIERDGIYRARAVHNADHTPGSSNPKALTVH